MEPAIHKYRIINGKSNLDSAIPVASVNPAVVTATTMIMIYAFRDDLKDSLSWVDAMM